MGPRNPAGRASRSDNLVRGRGDPRLSEAVPLAESHRRLLTFRPGSCLGLERLPSGAFVPAHLSHNFAGAAGVVEGVCGQGLEAPRKGRLSYLCGP